MDIINMSNRQLEELANACQVELQDRQYRVYDDALTHELYIDEVDEGQRQGYIDYLEELAGPGESPLPQEILSAWYSLQDLLQTRRTTGA